MLKNIIHNNNITVMNICALNIKSNISRKHQIQNMQEETGKTLLIIGNFNM